MLKEIRGLFAGKKPKIQKVETTYGGYFVKMMNGLERSSFDAKMATLANEQGKENAYKFIRGVVLEFTLCDENGVRLFSDDSSTEIDTYPVDFVDPLFKASTELNLLNPESVNKKVGELHPTTN